MEETTIPDCQHCPSRGRGLFRHCSEHGLKELSDGKTCTLYKKGQVIFHSGTLAAGLYCVFSGKIKLSRNGSYGKEQITRLIRPGDILGYRALLSDRPYAGSATVLEDAQVCFIPREEFWNNYRDNTRLNDALFKIMCQHMDDSERWLTEMAFKPVRERLAEALLWLRDAFGDVGSEEPFSIQFSRDDLAALVGTAKETVIRLLSEFKKDGIVNSKGQKITLISPEALERISRN